MMSRAIQCKLCNTEVQPTSWTEHLQGKRHLKLLSQCMDNHNPIRAEGQPTTSTVRPRFVTGPKTVFVNGQQPPKPSYENTRQPTTMDNSEFVNRQPPKQIYVMKQRPPAIDQLESASLLEKETFEKLCSHKTIDKQVVFLTETFGLVPNDYAQRNKLCRMLENLIGDFFPAFTLTIFGSYANNLAMTGKSDLDLYLEFNFETLDQPPSEDEIVILKTILKTLHYIRKQNKQRFLNTVKRMTLRSLIQIVGAIVRRFGQGCQNVFCITAARCPIVKFYDKNTKLNCDLSMNNRLAAENTKLLAFYQELDPRVHPLIFAIRFWAKSNKLCVENKVKLSSYAVSMLVVFYLQSCVPAILPTVRHLQSLLDEKPILGTWNYHFCRDTTKLAKTTNEESIELLLKGFFAFYSTMDWSSNVICTWDGTVVPISEFVKDNRNETFRLKLMNIQDPFQHDNNIAISANESLFSLFVNLIAKSNKILTSDSQSISSMTNGNVSGFAAILYLKIVVETKPRRPTEVKNPTAEFKTLLPSPPVANASVISQFNNFTTDFPVILNESVLNLYPEIFKQKKIVIGDKRKNVLLARLSKIIKTIFEKALQVECMPVHQEVTLKRQHNGSEDLVPSKVQILADEHDQTKVVKLETDPKDIEATRVSTKPESSHVFLCEVYHRIWVNRKKFRSFLVQECLTKPIMEVEEKLSMLIIENEGVSKPEKPIFKFLCSLNALQVPDKLGLQVQLSSNTSSKEFKGQFVTFLQSYVGKIANQAFLVQPK